MRGKVPLAALAGSLICTAALAVTPDYQVTPLTESDVALCLTILREAADHTRHLDGADKDAVATMQKYRGMPPMPKMPDTSKGLPSKAEMAAYGAAMGKAQAILGRASAVANYDEAIAEKRGVKERYDAIKNQFDDEITSGGTGIVGDGGGPVMNRSAADLAADKKRAAVTKADWGLIEPHAAEYQALRKTLRAQGGEGY